MNFTELNDDATMPDTTDFLMDDFVPTSPTRRVANNEEENNRDSIVSEVLDNIIDKQTDQRNEESDEMSISRSSIFKPPSSVIHQSFGDDLVADALPNGDTSDANHIDDTPPNNENNAGNGHTNADQLLVDSELNNISHEQARENGNNQTDERSVQIQQSPSIQEMDCVDESNAHDADIDDDENDVDNENICKRNGSNGHDKSGRIRGGDGGDEEDEDSGGDNGLSEEEREYIVERIIDKKIDSHGLARYLVKWEGFPSSANSWEPLEHLVDCDKMMQAYELKRAKKISDTIRQAQSGKFTQNFKRPEVKKAVRRQYEVNDVMGLTEVNGEMYFVISLVNSTQKAFIRSSLANKIFPGKVIDYFIKNIRWKSKPET